MPQQHRPGRDHALISVRHVPDVLPGLVAMALGFGAVFVGTTAAANAGVPSDKAGLAAGLLSTSQQIGMALGLAEAL